LHAFNHEPDDAARAATLHELLGSVGEDAYVRPPSFCDYGFNISIGSGSFLNFNCVVLDVMPVTIGAGAQIGSAVQLLAADHPRDPEIRRSGAENGAPVTIGDKVWIGSGTIVCPGVVVGADSIVGAGSVVPRDVPEGCVAAGNPCRAIREL
jgi:maltose O-acetyltransferase